jgi:hypothetical protein
MARGFETTTGLVIQQGLFEESLTAKHKLGTRMQLADGRVFYYAKAGETMVAGYLAGSKVTHADFINEAISTEAVGAKSIDFTPSGSTTVAANAYAEGYITIYEGTTGAGQIRKIKSHPVTGAGAEFTVTLYDPFTAIINADATATLVYNPFFEVEHFADSAISPAGVPLIAGTDLYYLWLQTWGIAAVLNEGGSALGMNLAACTTTGSLIDISTTITSQATAVALPAKPVVGNVYAEAGVDGKFSAVLLKIYP